MAVGSKSLGIVFYVSAPTDITVTPTKKSFVNNFDYLGDILSTRRIAGESNVSYKQRLMDVCVNPGGPDYEGIINNLTREFGYDKLPAITISLKANSAGEPIAANPRVDILANRIVLYSDWRPDGTEVIDTAVYFYKDDSDGYYLEDLATHINASTCFSATLDSSVRAKLHSTNLIRCTSDTYLAGDIIETGPQVRLVGSYITQGSLVFTDKTIFNTEVLVAPAADGEYYVDYTNGIIYPYNVPLGTSDVSYHYQIFPLVVNYSMIKIYTLQDDNFIDELFVQETLESGNTTDALPNNEGAEILHQLNKELPVFWGV